MITIAKPYFTKEEAPVVYETVLSGQVTETFITLKIFFNADNKVH